MTMSIDKGPALIADLERDAKHLADNERVSEEQARRVMGRIGLLLCDVARNAVSNEGAREIAVTEAEVVAAEQVKNHIIICRGTPGTPTTLKVAILIALSKSPWAIAAIMIALIYKPAALQVVQRFLTP